MKPFGVLFLYYGSKHAVQLAVSLWTLRRHYEGPVCVAAGDEFSQRVMGTIAADKRAGDLEVLPWKYPSGTKGSAYHAKTRMFDLSPFDATVFFDCDTIFRGPFAELFPTGERVILTEFAGWVTTGKRMRGRLLAWKEVAPLEVDRSVQTAYPAVNTGVVAFSRDAEPFMRAWEKMSARRISFICDEIAAQLVYPYHPHTIVGQHLNWSPGYSNTPVDDAVVIHCHGQGNYVRKPKHRDLWLPEFLDAWRENFGSIREWAPGGDSRLRAWMDANRAMLEGAA